MSFDAPRIRTRRQPLRNVRTRSRYGVSVPMLVDPYSVHYVGPAEGAGTVVVEFRAGDCPSTHGWTSHEVVIEIPRNYPATRRSLTVQSLTVHLPLDEVGGDCGALFGQSGRWVQSSVSVNEVSCHTSVVDDDPAGSSVNARVLPDVWPLLAMVAALGLWFFAVPAHSRSMARATWSRGGRQFRAAREGDRQRLSRCGTAADSDT